MRPLINTVTEALFRVLFTYDCVGEGRVPAAGPAVVAANHPSYLDPILVSLQVPRPIRFMAWEGLFKVPLLGSVLRAFGAFPVDTRPGRGRQAYETAKALVLSGEVVGIFPEGRRSRTGWMEASLRAGAARLAFETGAPLVPATITGAFRAWPYFRALPRPGRIRVRFHEPIDPLPFRTLPEEQALAGLLTELRRRVERSLLPGVKADLRMAVLYRTPSPRPRVHELLPAVTYAALATARLGATAGLVPSLAYVVYLGLDWRALPQSRLVKWIRNASPLVFALAAGPLALRALGVPPLARGALAAVTLGAAFPYLYERGRVALDFIRGSVAAALLELAALGLAPTPLGLHIALPVFAAAYAWERRTVFHRYAVVGLAVYVCSVTALLGGGMELSLHAAAGLAAWLVTRALPDRRPSSLALYPAGIVGPATTESAPADREGTP